MFVSEAWAVETVTGPGGREVLVSGDYTYIGIFLIWAGFLLFGWLLMNRVKAGAFRMVPKDSDEKSFMNVPEFSSKDKTLSFLGATAFMVGFGLIVLDLFR